MTISILGGDLLSALGDKKTRSAHLRSGSYQTVNKSMTIFGESREHPYYQLNTASPVAYLYDPIELIIPMIAQLITRLGLDKDALSRCGLFVGCSANDLSISHPLWLSSADPQQLTLANKRVGNGDYAARLSAHFGLNCFSLTYNTACTSSANAVIDAATMLQSKVIDYALVIGLEMFAQLSFEGFSSMQLLAQERVQPFDENRQGLVLGEALSAVFFSRTDVCASEWSFKGGISRSETSSVTGAKVDGSGIFEVMQQALISSSLSVADISVVKTHGTGSLMGDLAEINGMKLLFPESPSFFSFKPYIGHTLGACGVSELLLLMECVDQDFVPETVNFEQTDESLQWSPLSTNMNISSGTFLLNYFGFGGNNTSLIISKSVS